MNSGNKIFNCIRALELIHGPRLPITFEALNHPLHPESNPGHRYVIKPCTSITGTEEADQAERLMNLPEGRELELRKQGLLEVLLECRTAIIYVDTDLKNDMPQCRELQTQKVKDLSLFKAIDYALGPAEPRTRTKVYLGEFMGLVKAGTRCYNIATFLECATAVVAPNAPLKVSENLDEAIRYLDYLAN
ncbi:hypothetical protein DFP72DRAFT_1078934 [Ephemerocybe angulata]|uniref:Uncharacterized protein n=1 Tax=Ephemerocybe angulata TaxID=980116 RepID=A0A8H6LUE3_9AGAR|nr:hypothetical protein DFP72DRAFT_1078934 [Tulosesus angulatus]